MISDPFLNNVKQNNSIEDLALNKEILDVPTLVQYLKVLELSQILQKLIMIPNILSKSNWLFQSQEILVV